MKDDMIGRTLKTGLAAILSIYLSGCSPRSITSISQYCTEDITCKIVKEARRVSRYELKSLENMPDIIQEKMNRLGATITYTWDREAYDRMTSGNATQKSAFVKPYPHLAECLMRIFVPPVGVPFFPIIINNAMSSTSLHEYGHIFDYLMFKEIADTVKNKVVKDEKGWIDWRKSDIKFMMSDLPEFRKIFETYKKQDKLNFPVDGDYGSTNPMECFAESFRCFYEREGSRRFLMERLPLLYSYFLDIEQKMLKEGTIQPKYDMKVVDR